MIFPDLNADYIPPNFNVNARGALYLKRKGRHNWMKNQLDINVDFPPLFAWVREDVLQNILQSVMSNYVEDINNGFAVRLLADYNLFKRNKPKKEGIRNAKSWYNVTLGYKASHVQMVFTCPCPVSVSVLHRICSLHEPEENTDTTQAISCKHVHGIEEDCSKEAIRFLVVATCKDPNT
ncbi:hypothetical protein HKD37_19G052644 [Glycine soja]